MSEKGFPGAPFGIQSTRFTTSGVHPKNLVPGTFIAHGNTSSTSTEIGPGKYNPEYGGFSEKAVAKRASGPGWQREYELSHMMALPYLLNKAEWEERKLLPQKLGPGTYNPQDNFCQMTEKTEASRRGLLDLREPRFKDTIKDCVPGPGAYGIPHEALEAKRHQSFGNKGLLENGGDGIRTLPTWGSILGPGTYSFEDSIDQMLKKRTSVRGPYDLFTADRGKPIQTGHYATLANNNLGPGEYEYKSGIDDMKSRHKKKHGEFGHQVKYPRRPHDRIVAYTLALCPRDPSQPGPGHYDPKNPKDRCLMQGKNLPGFLSSSQRSDRLATKFFTGNYNSVGPGRYDVQKFEDAQDSNGHQSDFKSKTVRPYGERLKFLQERIKVKNVPVERRQTVIINQDAPKRCNDSLSKTEMQRSNLMSDMNRRGGAITVS